MKVLKVEEETKTEDSIVWRGKYREGRRDGVREGRILNFEHGVKEDTGRRDVRRGRNAKN